MSPSTISHTPYPAPKPTCCERCCTAAERSSSASANAVVQRRSSYWDWRSGRGSAKSRWSRAHERHHRRLPATPTSHTGTDRRSSCLTDPGTLPTKRNPSRRETSYGRAPEAGDRRRTVRVLARHRKSREPPEGWRPGDGRVRLLRSQVNEDRLVPAAGSTEYPQRLFE